MMTDSEKAKYNQMARALIRITLYMKPESLRRQCQKRYGLDYEEALEMAYENILEEARVGKKGVRIIP